MRQEESFIHEIRRPKKNPRRGGDGGDREGGGLGGMKLSIRFFPVRNIHNHHRQHGVIDGEHYSKISGPRAVKAAFVGQLFYGVVSGIALQRLDGGLDLFAEPWLQALNLLLRLRGDLYPIGHVKYSVQP